MTYDDGQYEFYGSSTTILTSPLLQSILLPEIHIALIIDIIHINVRNTSSTSCWHIPNLLICVCVLCTSQCEFCRAHPPSWPKEFGQSHRDIFPFLESPPCHELLLSDSPPKISIFLPFVISELCWKELLLLEQLYPMFSYKIAICDWLPFSFQLLPTLTN